MNLLQWKTLIFVWTTQVKKVHRFDEIFGEKNKETIKFYAREGRVKYVFYTNKSIILLAYNEACFDTNKIDQCVPSMSVSLLHEFNDMFFDYIHSGSPSVATLLNGIVKKSI